MQMLFADVSAGTGTLFSVGDSPVISCCGICSATQSPRGSLLTQVQHLTFSRLNRRRQTKRAWRRWPDISRVTVSTLLKSGYEWLKLIKSPCLLWFICQQSHLLFHLQLYVLFDKLFMTGLKPSCQHRLPDAVTDCKPQAWVKFQAVCHWSRSNQFIIDDNSEPHETWVELVPVSLNNPTLNLLVSNCPL